MFRDMITAIKNIFLLKLFWVENDVQGSLVREGVSNILIRNKKKIQGDFNALSHD